MRGPSHVGAASGMHGRQYRPDERGVYLIHPDDVRPFERAVLSCLKIRRFFHEHNCGHSVATGNGDWRIKGKLGFIYAVPGTLDEPGREGFLLYCERETKQAWTWAKKLLSFCAGTQDGDTEGVLFLGQLPTPADAETIRDVIGVAKRPVYDEEVMARKRERGRQIGEGSAQNRPRPTSPHPWEVGETAAEIPVTSAGRNAKPRGLDFNDFWGRHFEESGS